MINLVHVCNSYSGKLGGAERIVRYLHQGLLSQGYNSQVLGLYHNALAQDSLPLAQTLGNKTPYSFGVFFSLLRAMRQVDSDSIIFHVHLFPSLFYVAIFKRLKLLKGQIVATEHSTSNGRRNKWYGVWLDRFIFRSYEKVFAISSGAKQIMVNRKIMAESRVEVIENGAELHFEKPIARNVQYPLQLVSIGSLRPAKNYALFIKALAQVSFKEWYYTIVGEGEDYRALKQLIGDLGLQQKVKLAGRLDPVHPILSKAHLFVMPSAWEGFGLAAVEAMNASLPVVLSKVEGLKELVTHKKQVLPFAKLINPTDLGAMIEQLEEVFLSYDSMCSYANQAFIRAQRYSTESMVQSYRKAYQELNS